MECKWKSLPALQLECVECACECSLSLWLEKVVGMGNGEARRKTRKRSCSARHAPRNARLSCACAVAASSLLLWCERAMLLTPKVGLLDDPSVLSWNGEWMDAEWISMDGNGWMGNGWMGEPRRKMRHESCGARHASRNVSARLPERARCGRPLLRYRCERAMLLTPKADLRLVDPSRCSGQPALVSPT